jgi:hypothetical protein
MNDFSYSILNHIATISQRGSWALELNLISWAGRPATFDLRKWNEDHSKMSKGISLTRDEVKALGKFLVDNPID